MLTPVPDAPSPAGPPRSRPRPTILVVDDERAVRDLLGEGLSQYGFETVCVGGAEEALQALGRRPIALVLCDIHMPGTDGLQLLERIRREFEDLDVIMVTGVTDIEVAIGSMRRGASDYVTKPFHLEEVWLTVERTLEKRRLLRENAEYRGRLEQKVRERTGELLRRNDQVRRLYRRLRRSYQETLRALAGALETRDHNTRGHCLRVAAFAAHIARRMGVAGRDLADVRLGALLHDVGKIGIPDAVLQKPGPLTPEEWRLMQQHPALGARMLRGIRFLKGAIPIVLSHQERFDGTGYPHGHRGAEIPLGARIFAVVDTFDSMTSDRPYRRALPYARAFEEVRGNAGTQFDPDVVRVFLSIPPEEWDRIRSRVDRELPLIEGDEDLLPEDPPAPRRPADPGVPAARPRRS